MQIKAENFFKQITIRAYVDESKQPHPILTSPVWECKSCIRHIAPPDSECLPEGWQPGEWKPERCPECGGHKFELYKKDCTFTDLQVLKCLVEDQFITVYLRGCQCKPEGYKKGMYTITGRLNIDITQEPYVYYVDQVVDIHKMRK